MTKESFIIRGSISDAYRREKDIFLTHPPENVVSFDVLSVVCTIFVRLQSDFNSLYEIEIALMSKL